MTANTLKLRSAFRNDRHRPVYHYLPPSNWMNDPNGVIQWDGQYHLFYQYNPDGPFHANMHWGHAASSNLIYWEDLPIAIAPTPDSVDEGGIYSGCIVNHNNIPTAFYTGVNQGASVQTQCIATSSDRLITWQKHTANPVIPEPPSEMDQTRDFRDPFVWQEDDTWYMMVGSRIEGVGGAVLLYRSNNITDWEYLGPALVGDKSRNGIMWECPNFFKLGDKWVLIISSHIGYTTATVLYFVGHYENHRFTPEYEGVFDSGYYYAPLSTRDSQGRRIIWGWIREGRSVSLQKESGWTGVQAIPRLLTLDSENRLRMEPVPELEQIRGKHHHVDITTLDDHKLTITGNALDIQATFAIENETRCGLSLMCSSDDSEKVEVIYDATTGTLRVYRYLAESQEDVDTYLQGSVHLLDNDELLDLRILLDGSVIEIIANQRTSITSRLYPLREDSKQIRVVETASLKSLDIYELGSIWAF